MKKQELQKLVKVEKVIEKFVTDELKLTYLPIEFDVVPDMKMLEIMAYRSPQQISNWKYGRDYERLRTIHEKIGRGLPYEVVVHGNPARAYLMNSNTFPVHCTVMAHVFGHVTFFTMNKWFKEMRVDFLDVMSEAKRRFLDYERRFGVREVEKIVDAGHSIQYHSSPFDNETEDEKRERIYHQKRMQRSFERKSEFRDFPLDSPDKPKKLEIADIEIYNERLKRQLRLKNPVEPTEDILRWIIDNSRILENWQKDILEVLREEGRFLWPIIRTQFMNEGWATIIHEKIMKMLFDKGILSTADHASFNDSNARIKAENPTQLNPYLVGSTMFYDIEERWNKGRYGYEWEDCKSIKEKENWDTKEMKGWDKCLEVMQSYMDWFFFQDFFTVEMIDKLNLYLWGLMETMTTVDLVRTDHDPKEIREAIINSFAHSRVPKIEVVDGNFRNGTLFVHRHTGLDLDMKYTTETMKHIYNLTERDVYLDTILRNEAKLLVVFLKGDEVQLQILEKMQKKGNPTQAAKTPQRRP